MWKVKFGELDDIISDIHIPFSLVVWNAIEHRVDFRNCVVATLEVCHLFVSITFFLWYTTPGEEWTLDGSNGQTFILIQLFHNLRQESHPHFIRNHSFSWEQPLLKTLQLWLSALLILIQQVALHNDISYPSHLESQWRESLFHHYLSLINFVKTILCCNKKTKQWWRLFTNA